MIRIFRVFAALTCALSGLFAASQAGAVLLYTVDSTTNDLVTVDSATGSVTVVATLGGTAHDVDLALTADGRLWALNSQSFTRVDLWEVNKADGSIASGVQVTLGGSAITVAEGLAARGNALKIGYSPVGNSNSGTIGDLSFTVAISNSRTATLDLDGIGNGNGNFYEMYGFDRMPGISTILYGIDADTGSGSVVAGYSQALGFHDITATPGVLYTIDGFSSRLYTLDATTGAVIGNVLMDRTGSYNGLALADAEDVVPVPAPAGWAFLALGAFLAALRRR